MSFAVVAGFDHRCHSLLQHASAANFRICFQRGEGTGRELGSCVRVDLPVGNEQGPRARIEERAREARKRLSICRVSRRGIAGRKHHPIGIKLEPGNL